MFKNFIDIFYYWNYFDNHSTKSAFSSENSKITKDYSNYKLRKLIIDEIKVNSPTSYYFFKNFVIVIWNIRKMKVLLSIY